MNSRTSVTKNQGERVPSYAEKFVSGSVTTRLRHLVAPHVDSFNFFLEYGLNFAIEDLPPLDVQLEEGLYVKMHVTEASIAYPSRRDTYGEYKITPREARERGLSYSGAFLSTLSIHVSGKPAIPIETKLGDVPIMVMSERCHLKKLSPPQLVSAKEEANEMGGFFIVNGLERVIRLLQVPRRNHALALERNSFKTRGPAYTEKGVMMRCVREDQSSSTVTLHYLNNGSCTLRFVLRKQEFLLPVVIVIKALANITDREIFERIIQGETTNTFLSTRLELLLRDAKQYPVTSSAQACAYLGSLFRQMLPICERTSDQLAGRLLLDRYLFIHTADYLAKLECLLHMMRKLYSFAQGRCEADNADALVNHELLLPGHLFNMVCYGMVGLLGMVGYGVE